MGTFGAGKARVPAPAPGELRRPEDGPWEALFIGRPLALSYRVTGRSVPCRQPTRQGASHATRGAGDTERLPARPVCLDLYGVTGKPWAQRAVSLVGAGSLCPGSYFLPLGFQISLGLIRLEKGPAPLGVPRSPLGSCRHTPCWLSRAQKPGPGRRPAASSPSCVPGRNRAD